MLTTACVSFTKEAAPAVEYVVVENPIPYIYFPVFPEFPELHKADGYYMLPEDIFNRWLEWSEDMDLGANKYYRLYISQPP